MGSWAVASGVLDGPGQSDADAGQVVDGMVSLGQQCPPVVAPFIV
jgi:hypothetical protein